MARRKSKKNPQLLERAVIGAMLLAIGVAIYFNHLAKGVESSASKSGEFDVLRGAKFIPHGSNDGDSFHIAHGGREFVFRLYYVDCPEKSSHRFRQRIAEQGEYFGSLAEGEVVALGLDGKDYVDDLLRRNEFTIYTSWEEVYDSGRYFAFVEIGDQLLSELLVQRGLARIYTKGVTLPDGEKFRSQRDDLRAMEADAKKAQLGGWGNQ